MTSFYTKQCLQIVSDYRASGGPWPAKKAEMAEWALLHKRWQPSSDDIRRMCGDALAEAMREDTFTDESGRSIRSMLPAKTTRDGEQGTFWDDLRTAPIGHVRIGVTQRRNAIAAECYHLSNIVRFSNERRGESEQIMLSLDFADDVRELDEPIGKKQKAGRATAASSREHSPLSARPRTVPPPSASQRVRRPPSSQPSGHV